MALAMITSSSRMRILTKFEALDFDWVFELLNRCLLVVLPLLFNYYYVLNDM